MECEKYETCKETWRCKEDVPLMQRCPMWFFNVFFKKDEESSENEEAE